MISPYKNILDWSARDPETGKRIIPTRPGEEPIQISEGLARRCKLAPKDGCPILNAADRLTVLLGEPAKEFYLMMARSVEYRATGLHDTHAEGRYHHYDRYRDASIQKLEDIRKYGG